MIKTSTQNDLIRYIYGETTTLETENVMKGVLNDPEIMNDFDEFNDLIQSLNQVCEEPSQRSVDKILGYSGLFKLPELTD